MSPGDQGLQAVSDRVCVGVTGCCHPCGLASVRPHTEGRERPGAGGKLVRVGGGRWCF